MRAYQAGMKTGGTFQADPKRLASVDAVHSFLRDLIEVLGMTALGYHIYDVPIAVQRLGQEPLHDEGGITGVAVLSTSHAAIHTWPEDGGASFDLHSCRDYDPDRVIALLETSFGARNICMHNLSFSLKE